MQVEIKEAKSKARLSFEKSLENIKEKRSTGNAKLDSVGDKVLTALYEGRLNLEGDEANGYHGKLGEAPISITRIPHGTKSTRLILGVAGLQIQGEYAARAHKMTYAKHNKKGRASINVDEAQVDDVCALLG